jgi:hypothetical protein
MPMFNVDQFQREKFIATDNFALSIDDRSIVERGSGLLIQMVVV